jgi:hypothetical protein
MAFPGTKIIFTGRPNFFLDEKERNRTWRTDVAAAAAGGAFSQVWDMEKLTEPEVSKVARGFGRELGDSIVAAAKSHSAFFEIISRPSMLPVVATIWPKIVELQSKGHNLTGAVLLEHYLRATYLRKEKERAEEHERALEASNYLLLPQEVREIFTLAVVWRMACSDARNTITRSSFDTVISHIYDDVFRLAQRLVYLRRSLNAFGLSKNVFETNPRKNLSSVSSMMWRGQDCLFRVRQGGRATYACHTNSSTNI